MTPEAQGAVERAAGVLAHILCIERHHLDRDDIGYCVNCLSRARHVYASSLAQILALSNPSSHDKLREAGWATPGDVAAAREEGRPRVVVGHLADIAAADALATPSTASHDETAMRAGVEAVRAIHDRTHWCFNDDEQDSVYERGTEWWPCPTLAALAARAAAGDADPAGESGGSDG